MNDIYGRAMTGSRLLVGSLRWLVAGLVCLASLIVSGPIAQMQGAVQPLDLPPDRPDAFSAAVCGTDGVYLRSLGLVAPRELADGQGLMFDQTPAILRPDQAGNFSIKVQLVGDFATVQFVRSDSEATEETWSRSTTRTVGGRVISIFEKVYPDSELARTLRVRPWGFDDGGVFWGYVVLPTSGTRVKLSLRMGSTNLPAATPLVPLGADAQYAGNVVNIVISDFGDSRVADGDLGFDLKAAAKKFYEYFPDSYDMIAFIPQSGALAASFDAFHQNVKSDVTGIGLSAVDNTADYGSGGTLLGVEVYGQTAFTEHATSNHEIMHQWGHYLDLTGLAGVEGKGLAPSVHTPLTKGATLLGAVLEATRTVTAIDGGAYEIRQSSFPILQHPLEMYAMGKVSSDALETLLIFEDQGQFDPAAAATPTVGTRLAGGVKEVTVGAILGKHGARSGPSPSVIRRATVLVSRDGLASAAEMNYWNFFAQRLADPNRTGVPSFEGYASFDRSTQNAVDLQTDVAPKAGSAAGAAVEVTTPRFGKKDWRGVDFDDTVPSRFVAGQRVTLSGRVTATDHSDFNIILIRFLKYDGSAESVVSFQIDLTRSGTFTAPIEFTAAQRGLYRMEVFLFWPGAPGQTARSLVTPILVE